MISLQRIKEKVEALLGEMHRGQGGAIAIMVLAALLILYFTDTATDDEHADMLIEVLLAAHAMGAPQGNA